MYEKLSIFEIAANGLESYNGPDKEIVVEFRRNMAGATILFSVVRALGSMIFQEQEEREEERLIVCRDFVYDLYKQICQREN